MRCKLLRAVRTTRISSATVATKSSVAASFNAVRDVRKFEFWKEKVGLFQVPHLTTPDGFRKAKDLAVSEGWRILERATSVEPGEETILLFDELSDTLCRVADLADFIKCSHPKEQYADAASEAHLSIGTMVEQLNTNRDLFRALQRVTDDPRVRDTLDAETQTVADLFMEDFKISGIHLQDEERRKAVNLHEELLQTISYFMQSAHSPVLVPKQLVPHELRHNFQAHGDQDLLVSGLHVDNHHEAVREAAYRIYYHDNVHNEELLARMLGTRYELAKLLGYNSFSERCLTSTTAGNPHTVGDFLSALSAKVRPLAEAEMQQLRNLKAQDFSRKRANNDVIKPWDVPYYCARLKEKSWSIDSAEYSDFFSLGDCMEGLNNLFQSLYGVMFTPVQPERGELWSDDVIKLAVTSCQPGGHVLGFIYCDFFVRKGKPQQDCHFTIRGGRRMRDGSYQLPIVVLMLHLKQPRTGQPTLLTPGTMGNLFHEMGHAMHSMLARTRYQHVTGTRCATDFAEVPSILMEYFAADPRVLRSFARHHKRGDVISEEMVSALCKSDKIGSAIDTQTQVFYSIMDQAFHGIFDRHKSTSAILAQIQKHHHSLPAEDGVAWQHRFSHFASYGAKYYSYLMSRAIASRVWQSCFQPDPFNHDMGSRYRSEMLQHGGGKHPVKMYESLLQEQFDVDCLVDTLLSDLNN